MSTMIDRIRREPALVTGLVAATIALVVSFGLELSKEQVGAIMAVVAAILAFVTRSQVTPYVDVVEHAVGTEVVAGPANDLVAEGHVVREVPTELLPELVRHGDELDSEVDPTETEPADAAVSPLTSEGYVGEHRADNQ